jgi:hypothetical protein
MAAGPRCTTLAWTAQKTPHPTVTPFLRVTRPLPDNGRFSDSTFLALKKYTTICLGDYHACVCVCVPSMAFQPVNALYIV